MNARRADLISSVGLLALRLGFGGYMLTHGWGKFPRVIQGKFDGFADPIGLGSGLSLVAAAGAEFGCALLVIVGAATRFAAAPVVFTMLVAAFVAHAGDPWTAGEANRLVREGLAESNRNRELAMLFLFGFGALIFTGAGRFSVDAMALPWLQRQRARRKAAAKQAAKESARAARP